MTCRPVIGRELRAAVAGVGMLVIAVLGMLVTQLPSADGGVDADVVAATLAVWFIACLIYNAWLVRRAKRFLGNDFRLLATR
jgi:hypothetical protein